jgi:hypothetical protein
MAMIPTAIKPICFIALVCVMANIASTAARGDDHANLTITAQV